MSDRCATCRFWLAGGSIFASKSPTDNGQGEVGACRRLPPVPTPDHDFFPRTHADQWCGEYRARKGQPSFARGRVPNKPLIEVARPKRTVMVSR